MQSKRQIAIALTHYNRPELLYEAIRSVHDDPRVKEIVISDDASEKGLYERLELCCANWSKVVIYRNPANLDCYRNKAAALSHVSLQWSILLDSDNIIGLDYLDALYPLTWDEDTFYLPEFAQPAFDYREFTGCVITKQNVARFMDRPNFQCMLNTANYFVPTFNYLKVFDPNTNPHTADTIYQAYNWLKSGGKLAIVKGLRYFHRIHAGSHYKQNVHKTGDFAKTVERKLRDLR